MEVENDQGEYIGLLLDRSGNRSMRIYIGLLDRSENRSMRK